MPNLRLANLGIQFLCLIFLSAAETAFGLNNNCNNNPLDGISCNGQNPRIALSDECIDLQGQFEAAKDACHQLHNQGVIGQYADSGDLSNCLNATGCNDDSLFTADDDDSDDVDPAKITDQEVVAFATGVSSANPYSAKYKTLTIPSDSDIAPVQGTKRTLNITSKSTCNGASLQQNADFLKSSEKIYKDNLQKDEEKISKLSNDINTAQSKLQAEEEARTQAIQSAELDSQKAQSDLSTQINSNNNQLFSNLSKLQGEYRTQQDKIRDNSPGGTSYNLALNAYQQALGTALAKCEAALAANTKNGKISAGSLNGLLSLSNPNATTSTNIFANNGQLTQQFCAANNNYIMAKSQAYHDFITALSKLSENIKDAQNVEKQITDQEISLSSAATIRNQDIMAQIRDRMAKDQLTVSNNSTILQSETMRDQNASGAMTAPIKSIAQDEASNARAIAVIEAKLDAYKVQDITPARNDMTEDQLAKTITTIETGKTAATKLTQNFGGIDTNCNTQASNIMNNQGTTGGRSNSGNQTPTSSSGCAAGSGGSSGTLCFPSTH